MKPDPNSAEPSPGDREQVRILKDGYWERTSVVRTPDGELRVRKESRADGADQRPWARRSLAREILYLEGLPASVATLFPELRATWGAANTAGPLGYEMAFLEDFTDLGSLVQSGSIAAESGQRLDRQIAEVVFGTLHEECEPDEPLSTHFADVVATACATLEPDPDFAHLIGADSVIIDGVRVPGVRRSLEKAGRRGLVQQLDERPQVRLHGDLILENILVPSEGATTDRPFLFIDPVSVAGVASGHPAFDLVKYQSYASGLLYAIRSGALLGRGISDAGGEYEFAFDLGKAAADHFRAAGLGEGFSRRYIERYGTPNPDLLNLLDAYFSLAMAINTTGAQPLTRALMAAKALARIS